MAGLCPQGSLNPALSLQSPFHLSSATSNKWPQNGGVVEVPFLLSSKYGEYSLGAQHRPPPGSHPYFQGSLCPLWVPVSFLSLAFSYLENGENGAHCLPSTELMRRWRGLLSLCPSLFRSFPALSCSALSPRKLTSADCNSCILLRLASLWAQLGAPGE